MGVSPGFKTLVLDVASHSLGFKKGSGQDFRSGHRDYTGVSNRVVSVSYLGVHECLRCIFSYIVEVTHSSPFL